MSSPVKVRGASLSPSNGTTVLSLLTTEGVTIQFDLDDMALGLLGMCIRPVLELAMSRDPRLHSREEISSKDLPTTD